MKYNWTEIQEYYDNGLSVNKLCNKLNISPGSVSAAAKRGDIVLLSRKKGIARSISRKHLDWVKIQAYYDADHTIMETAKHFRMMKQNISNSRFFKSRPKTEQAAMTVATRRKNGTYCHTQATKDKLSRLAIDRGFGGKTYRNLFPYGGVILESSYELSVAKDLDRNNIRWERCSRFYWVDHTGKKRHYTPDFFLPDYDIYLDPKNDYLITQDQEKIRLCSEQNDIIIYILNKNQLDWLNIKDIAGLV